MSDDSTPGQPVDPFASAPTFLPAEEPDVAPARRRSNRRLLAGVGATTALLVLVVVVLLPHDPDGPGAREVLNVGSLAAPKAARDLVPSGPIVTKYPAACGVPDAVARELVPGSRPGGRERGLFADTSKGVCLWYALNDGEEQGGFVPDGNRLRKERVLHVDIVLGKASSFASPIGGAMEQIDRGPVGAPTDAALRVVTGLGEEARAGYSPALDEGAFVRFRVGNAAVLVNYGGWDRKGKDPAQRQLPEKTAMAGALRAAAGIAKNVGVPTRSTPSFALPQAAAPVIQRLPKPCDTVSAETLRKVANGAYRERGVTSLVAPSPGTVPDQAPAAMRGDACRWTTHTATSTSLEAKDSARNVEVTIAAVSGRQPGSAVQFATREYLRQHHNARDGKKDGTINLQQGFTAISGLGDQAFVVYGEHPGGGNESPGRVVFRLRNVLVQVRYFSDSQDDDPLTRSEAINGAYTVALDVAGSLSRP
jgi:hypothetical protein